MSYENVVKIAREFSCEMYQNIKDSICDLSKEEFYKIPIIDANTKIVAERYGIVFTHQFKDNFRFYYKMYLICSCLFRDEKEVDIMG